jgi:hypothetical protein
MRDMGPNRHTKLCAECETLRPIAGGVDLRPGRWVCAACWLLRQQRRKEGQK